MKKITEILANDASTVHMLLTARKLPQHDSYETLMKQWDPYKHDVFDKKKRKPKKKQVPTDQKDPLTNKTIYRTEYVERVRIALPTQKVVVNRLVGFLLTNAVTYKANSHGVYIKTLNDKQQKLYDAIMHCYHDNKMKYFDKKLVRTVSSQCEAAELWYMTTDENGRLGGEIRVQLLSPKKGDKLYPHFNDWHRMDGFGREYYIFDELGTSELHFDLYTDRFVYKYINKNSGWSLIEAKAHGFTKIPVVYYHQYKSEWADVQWACERVEESISNWGDTNDYFGSPKCLLFYNYLIICTLVVVAFCRVQFLRNKVPLKALFFTDFRFKGVLWLRLIIYRSRKEKRSKRMEMRQEYKTVVRCLSTLGGSLCYEMLKTLLFPCYLQGLPFIFNNPFKFVNVILYLK